MEKKMKSLVPILHPSQVVNHGISQRVIDDALGSLSNFFESAMEEKKIFLSDDVKKPVRFGTSRSNGKVSRDFIKLYANPIEDWIGLWPHDPTDFRENVGKYASEVRRLGIDIMGAVTESLGLSPTYLRNSLEQGMHILVANTYPQCSPTSKILGLPPHTDHSIITFLLESTSGLEIMDFTDSSAWKSIPAVKGTLKVIVGSHLEVLSNGMYKSVFHRATPSPRLSRVSVASFLSLRMGETVEPAVELVDEEHPQKYRATSLDEFFNHLSSNEERPYIDCLKI
ncbi:hypothetical protein TB2_031508 [Malus domestica]|uniref:Fe2OG dioxygenase domain-containing protein n=1 Tax=Malus domestica TaxID=3750 RepID=A0A498JYC3_MALDO|nr:hypothetical protein DVH24_001113 [Malus domestica]